MNFLKSMGEGPYIPPFIDVNEEYNGGKIPSDNYQVFVNGEYVGDKKSVAQGDGDWHSIESFAKGRGFNNLDIRVEGNRVDIRSDSREQAIELKRHLNVYLQTR